MATIPDHKRLSLRNEIGKGIAHLSANFKKGEEDINPGNEVGEKMDALPLSEDLPPKLSKNLGLPCQDPGSGLPEAAFKGDQLGESKTLGVCQGLLSKIVGRHLLGLRLRHLDIVSGHLVVADPESLHPCPGTLPLLEGGDEAVSFGFDPAVTRESLVELVPDDGPLPQHGGRIVDDGPGQEIPKGGGVEPQSELPPIAGKELFEPLHIEKIKGRGKGLAKLGEIPVKTIAHGNPGENALKVSHPSQDLIHPIRKARSFVKAPDYPVPRKDLVNIGLGGEEPGAEHPAPRRSPAAIEEGDEARCPSSFLPHPLPGKDVEVADRPAIEGQRIAGPFKDNPPKVAQDSFFVVGQKTEEKSDGIPGDLGKLGKTVGGGKGSGEVERGQP